RGKNNCPSGRAILSDPNSTAPAAEPLAPDPIQSPQPPRRHRRGFSSLLLTQRLLEPIYGGAHRSQPVSLQSRARLRVLDRRRQFINAQACEDVLRLRREAVPEPHDRLSWRDSNNWAAAQRYSQPARVLRDAEDNAQQLLQRMSRPRRR